MSIQNNTPKLQELMDKVNSLPTVENLDSELSEQDSIITQLNEALAGKVAGGGGNAEPVLQDKTVTPVATTQTIKADTGYDGLDTVIVEGDENLKSENIAEGVSIFGVLGSHTTIDESELVRQSEIMDEILVLLATKKPELYPEGAFRVVSTLTAGKSYVLAFSYEGVLRYLTDTAFNDWTVQAANLSAQDNGSYAIFSGNPTRFTASASGSGFTFATTAGSLTGNASSGGTDLKVDSNTGTVFTVDTSETGGFSSDVYIPKADTRAVWLRASLNSQNCCLKYESANNSIGIDYAGRDATYSTGFVPFLLYELCEGEAMA